VDAHPEYYGKMSQPKNPEAAVTEVAPAVTEAPAAEVAPVEVAPATETPAEAPVEVAPATEVAPAEAPVETAPAPVKTTSTQSI